MRALFVRLHRWAGLAVAAFLIVVGLTGALLAFYPELSRALSPELFPGPRAGRELPLGELARIAEEIVPGAQVSSVFVGYSGTAMISLDAAPGAPALDFTRIYLDTASGRELGRMHWGAFPSSAAMIMPFIYTLHYSLAMGEIGVWVMGIVAVIWTVDCFVSFFVTLPPQGGHARKSFLSRWKPAWLIKSNSSFYRLNFDIHRAGGLWLWGMLFVFAWSSVYWNMTGLYVRVTDALFGFSPPQWARPAPGPTRSGAQAPMGWRDAQTVADRLLSDQSQRYGLTVDKPVGFNLMRDQGTYSYDALSSLDIGEKYGGTSVVFDAHTGALVDTILPTGQRAGNTITHWISELHMADVFGLPFKMFVSLFGCFVTLLSATGVYIWWTKRRVRIKSRRVPAGASPARLSRSWRSVASYAWSSATAAAKRKQRLRGVRH